MTAGRRLIVAAASLLLLLPGPPPAAAAARRSYAPSRSAGSLVAKIVVETVARAGPGSGRVLWPIPTSTSWGDGPQQLLVLDRSLDAAGREWLLLRIPIRPNGSAGWVRADDVLLSTTPYWIDASLSRRTITVFRRGVVVRRVSAVVGAPATPTPEGLFSIYDPVAQPNPSGFLGPWALHLTGFSNVLDDYGGGPGRIAIHGRGGESLLDPLGTARSHGCLRVDNADVTWLAQTVPRGTPVMIRS